MDTYKEKEIYNEARAKREKNELRANSEKIQKYDKYDTYKGNIQQSNNENEARAKPEKSKKIDYTTRKQRERSGQELPPVVSLPPPQMQGQDTLFFSFGIDFYLERYFRGFLWRIGKYR